MHGQSKQFSAHSTNYTRQSKLTIHLQLDCPSVRHWDYVITFAVEVRFQIRDQFWIIQPKLRTRGMVF